MPNITNAQKIEKRELLSDGVETSITDNITRKEKKITK